MKNQLRNVFTANIKPAAIGLLASAMLILMSAGSASASLTFGVTFGTAQENNGPCVGKGVCKESFDMDPNTLIYASNPEAVSVTFQISPDNPNVLMMSFLMSELKSKQPDQVAYFTNSTGTYPFDATYSLANSAISQLNIPAGAVISTNSNSTVVINGDIVTDYITLVTN